MKKWTIISDSSCDLRSSDLTSKYLDFITVPLSILLGEKEVVDVDELNLKQFITDMNQNKAFPKTSCPAPGLFFNAMAIANDNILVLTISSKLSGSYNSALSAASQLKVEFPQKNVFVLDSLNASAGMTKILFKIKEILENPKYVGYSFTELTSKFINIRNMTRINFILQDFTNLLRTGRMGKITGLIANILSIKLVMSDNMQGEIKVLSKHLGTKKALIALAGLPQNKIKECGPGELLVINHCDNLDLAKKLKEMLIEKFKLTNIKIFPTRGLASFYAGYKGLLLAY
ncbi:MAG: DegV family protein [Acholeplasmatales bacterium]|jgi:DegV family protein with EDD domain|nr:DegV family protein [Acholeplasmatales bacterium]